MLKFNDTSRDLRKMSRHAVFSDKLNENIVHLNEMIKQVHQLDAEVTNHRQVLDNLDSGNVDADEIRTATAEARKANFESLVMQLKAMEFLRTNIVQQHTEAQTAEKNRRFKAARTVLDEKRQALEEAGIENEYQAAELARKNSEVVSAFWNAEDTDKGGPPEPTNEDFTAVKAALREAAERL